MGRKRYSGRKSDEEISRIHEIFENKGRMKVEAAVVEEPKPAGSPEMDEEQLRRAKFAKKKDLQEALARKKFALVIETEQRAIDWIVHSFRRYRMDQATIRQVNVQAGFAIMESAYDNVTSCISLDGIRGVEWDGKNLTFTGSRTPIQVGESVIYAVGCETGVYCRTREVKRKVGHHFFRPTKFLAYTSPAIMPE